MGLGRVKTLCGKGRDTSCIFLALTMCFVSETVGRVAPCRAFIKTRTDKNQSASTYTVSGGESPAKMEIRVIDAGVVEATCERPAPYVSATFNQRRFISSKS
jgi:hypothetical protein